MGHDTKRTIDQVTALDRWHTYLRYTWLSGEFDQRIRVIIGIIWAGLCSGIQPPEQGENTFHAETPDENTVPSLTILLSLVGVGEKKDCPGSPGLARCCEVELNRTIETWRFRFQKPAHED